MIISVVNQCRNINDGEAMRAIRAVNRQLQEDFRPFWHIDCVLRLEGNCGNREVDELVDLRGDGIIFLRDRPDGTGTAGYHDANNRGIPYGFVFKEIAESCGEHWSCTLSHEALEMAADPEANRLAEGPHPDDPEKRVFHWIEICDAVQSENYFIDEVQVSNFVLPHYYTRGEEVGMRNDFLNISEMFNSLQSFGAKDGGYVGFFNPDTGEHETWHAGSEESEKRIAAKGKTGRGKARKIAKKWK